MSVRYQIDFGKYGILNIINPVEEKIDFTKKYPHNLSNFMETDSWVYVNFVCKEMYYNLFYSKKVGKSFYTNPAKPTDDELRCYGFSLLYNDQFISTIEASYLCEELERISPEGIKKWNLEKYKSINPDDNPVLIFYKMKAM